MSGMQAVTAGSPLLDHCPPSLPAGHYVDPAHHQRELATIWAHNWIYALRDRDLAVGSMRRLAVAGQSVILIKDKGGAVTCFINSCRHRGSELCAINEARLASRLITCPYHAWSYDLSGRLVRTPNIVAHADFRKEDHGLMPVAVRAWDGFLFVCLAKQPPDFAGVPDCGVPHEGALAFHNWPMAELVTGHTLTTTIDCNWKVFWENYNECLHCPGIHPGLIDRVPVYAQGIMAANEHPDWAPEPATDAPVLKAGARTWTVDGQPCGREFPNLSDAERAAGHTFVTLLPSLFIVAHVDYVRAVSLRPLGPELMELRAEWLFPAATLSAPGFNLANVIDFASQVLREDASACEMNQRGLRNSAFQHGTLMPQEFEVHRFQNWVREQLPPIA